MTAHDSLAHFALIILVALACGALLTRLKQPAILGYMLAGLLLGPAGFTVIADREQIAFLAELGIMTLLFTIGTELPVTVVRRVWRPALTTCLLQTVVAGLCILPIATTFAWQWQVGLLWTFILALSSTAVVMKTLISLNIIESPPGKLISGILIGQDILFIPMMTIIAAVAVHDINITTAFHVVMSLALLVGIIFLLGRRASIKLPLYFIKDQELLILRAVFLCFGSAALASVIGLSPAYGAFLSGLILAHSSERDALLEVIRPVSNLLMMMFFISIGMLIDINFILSHMGTVFAVLLAILVVKTLATIAIARFAGEPLPHAIIAGVLLAQIGEFSFLLAQQGLMLNLIGAAAYNLIIAVTVLSLIVTPLWIHIARRVFRFAMRARSWQELLQKSFGDYQEKLDAIIAQLQKKPPS